MPPPEVLAAFSALAAKKFAEKVATDVYNSVKAKVSKEFSLFKNKKVWATLYRRAREVRKVKTLWQIDKPVDLGIFYYPTKLIVSGKKRVISEYDAFVTDAPIVVEGIAGQGKSIFLRFLCARELEVGSRIPVFIELRKYDEGGLQQQIQDALTSLGLDYDADIVDGLLKAGKLLLLLDAFDEVDSKFRVKCISDVERLEESAPGVPIVITARPNSQIQASRLFHVWKISDLDEAEYKQVIHKLCNDSGLANDIISQIEKSQRSIGEMLTTPLFVTLLVIQFKASQQIPENIAGFYDSLLDVLLKRHDGTKPGYIRPRQCGLNDRTLRKIFEAFCFVTKFAHSSEYNRNQICRGAELAAKETSIKVDSEKFIDDVVKVTCLLIEEGGQFRFIHKSVQEYYCAAYVKRRPAAWARKFYTEARGSGSRMWEQELYFLSEIDSFRYATSFAIPELEDLIKGSENIEIWARGLYNEIKAIVFEDKKQQVGFVYDSKRSVFQQNKIIGNIRPYEIAGRNEGTIIENVRKVLAENKMQEGRSRKQVGLFEISKQAGSTECLLDLAEGVRREAQSQLDQLRTRTRQEDGWTAFQELRSRLHSEKGDKTFDLDLD